MLRSLSSGYSALVIGASGAIGQAICAEFEADPGCASLLRLSRSTFPGFDLRHSSSLAAAASALSVKARLAVVIDATGALSTGTAGPEKSLAALDPAAMQELMQINAVGPLLLLRELAPRLARDRCLYGKLSARVGSIEDNRLGGWYSYRASKASLNMLLQTAAVELHRRLPGLVIAAMQPGTVVSSLSRRFVSATTPVVEARQAAAGLLKTLDTLEAGPRAHFVDYRGQMIPW